MNKRIELKDDRRGDIYDLSLSLLQLRSTTSGNVQMFVGNEWRPVQGYSFVGLQQHIANIQQETKCLSCQETPEAIELVDCQEDWWDKLDVCDDEPSW